MEYFLDDLTITQAIAEFENILDNINEFLAIEMSWEELVQ